MTPDSTAQNSLRALRERVNERVDISHKAKSELEENLARVREAYRSQLTLLKELELDRIDLQASVQWLASSRQNWRSQHGSQRIAPSPQLESQLVNEAKAAMQEVHTIDEHIAQVSAQATKLREVRDAIERRLVEKREQVYLESSLLSHCHK